jgi:hypothetical protein
LKCIFLRQAFSLLNLCRKYEGEEEMYKIRTRAANGRIRRSNIHKITNTTDNDFRLLLPKCGCNCEKLRKILQTVPTLYHYTTAYTFKYGVPKPSCIIVVPAGCSSPNETVALNEAAKKYGCRIKFTFQYPETGILCIEPA